MTYAILRDRKIVVRALSRHAAANIAAAEGGKVIIDPRNVQR